MTKEMSSLPIIHPEVDPMHKNFSLCKMGYNAPRELIRQCAIPEEVDEAQDSISAEQIKWPVAEKKYRSRSKEKLHHKRELLCIPEVPAKDISKEKLPEDMQMLKMPRIPFVGKSTYKDHYAKWDLPEKVYKEKEEYCPPEIPFKGMSTAKCAYGNTVHLPVGDRAKSFKPVEKYVKLDVPLDDMTVYREMYQPYQLEQRRKKPKAEYTPPKIKMETMTTFADSFPAFCARCRSQFKPKKEEPLGEKEPFVGTTTFRSDFPKHKLEPHVCREPEKYKKPEGEVNYQTMHQINYRWHDGVGLREPVKKPVSNFTLSFMERAPTKSEKCKSEENIDGNVVRRYQKTYCVCSSADKDKCHEEPKPCEEQKQAMSFTTTFNDSFLPLCVHRTKPYKPGSCPLCKKPSTNYTTTTKRDFCVYEY